MRRPELALDFARKYAVFKGDAKDRSWTRLTVAPGLLERRMQLTAQDLYDLQSTTTAPLRLRSLGDTHSIVAHDKFDTVPAPSAFDPDGASALLRKGVLNGI